MRQRVLGSPIVALGLAVVLLATVGPVRAQAPLDAAAARWVEETLEAMSTDEKVGQLLVPSFFSVYTSNDSAEYDRLAELVERFHVGGMLVFGARQPRPDVLLNPTYARAVLGEPLSAASLINRLQDLASTPLLVAADFETGLGFRLSGGTAFPRAMALGATADPDLAFEAGRITAREARSIGVHLNLAPVVDVNNNPLNPVINTRSFGEDPDRVAELATAYASGLQAGGMLATLKHFPGHGDTDVDSHRALPVIAHARERLDEVELVPFREGIADGVDAVMTAHIELPGLAGADGTPATFSAAIVGRLLREELGFGGLVVTDSMRMRAVTELAEPGLAAARAVLAGHDLVIHSPDDQAAYQGIRDAVARGTISPARLDDSVRRILTAKARLGLHRSRRVSLEAIPNVVGTDAHRAVARAISRRSLTLLKDAGRDLPLTLPPEAEVLYLSVLDRPSGWGVITPSGTVIPELERRWSNVTAIELSNRTPVSEIELVRETASRYDAVVVGLFIRAAALDGRLDLAGPLLTMLRGLARSASAAGQPLVTVLFGSPYVAAYLDELPVLLATFDGHDLAQATAVQAVAGEIPIQGRLPVSLGDAFPLGHGLDRVAGRAP